MIAGQLEIQMMADMARLKADMDRGVGIVSSGAAAMQRAADLVKGALGGIAAGLSLAAFSGWIKGAIAAADETGKLAQKMGVATRDVAGLQLAFKQAGLGQDVMVSSMSRLARGIVEGNDALKALGIQTTGAGGAMRAQKAVLYDVADAFQKMPDGAQKAAMALELFGKTGADMIPLLNGGAEGLREMDAMAKKLGLTVEAETARKAEQFNDTLELIGLGSQGVTQGIAAELLPTLANLATSFLTSMTNGDGLSRIAGVISTVLKTLYTVAVGVVEVFNTLGKAWGATFAVIGAVMRGDFAQAAAIAKDSFADIATGWKNTSAAISTAWATEANAAVTSATTQAAVNRNLLEEQKKRADAAKKAAAAAKQQADSFDGLVGKLAGKEAGVDADFLKNMKLLADEGRRRGMAEADIVRLQEQYLKQQPFLIEQEKQRAKLAKEAHQQTLEWEKEEADAALAASKAREQALLQMDEFERGARLASEAAQFELSILSQNEASRARLLPHYRNELAVKERIRQIDMDTTIDAQLKDELKGRARGAGAVQGQAIDVGMTVDALKEVQSYLDPARPQEFGQALRDCFGSAGDSLQSLLGALQNYGQQQAEIEKRQEKLALIKPGMDGYAEAQKAMDGLAKRSAQNQVKAFGDIAGAAKGFFKEHSKGYKAMEAVEKTFRAFELAQAAMSYGKQLGWIVDLVRNFVTGEASKTAAVTASVAPEVAASLAKGQAAATAGVANQAGGDPYTAFFRIAAMVALMAGLGFAVKGGSGGGGGVSAARRQEVQGTGTVLGDPTAKSESLSKALELLADTAQIELRYQAQMVSSLRTIANSLAGVATMVLRNAQLTGDYKGPEQLGSWTNAPKWADPFGKSKLMSALFGKTTRSLKDTGIRFDSFNVSDVMGGANVRAQAYAIIEETKKSLFRTRTSTITELNPVGDELTKQFTMIVRNMVKVAEGGTKALGLSGEEFQRRLQNLNIDIGDVSFKDMDGKQVQEALNAIFSKMGDQMIGQLMPEVARFQQVGEGMLETLVRVAAGVETAQYELEKLGITAINWQDLTEVGGDVASNIFRQSVATQEGPDSNVNAILGAVGDDIGQLVEVYTAVRDIRMSLVEFGNAAADVSQEMIRGAGGLQELQDGVASFRDRYYSNAERLVLDTQRMATEFNKLGLAMPANRAAFRALVDGVDTSTDAGARLFGQLMALADGFADVAESAESAAAAAADAAAQAERDRLSALSAASDAYWESQMNIMLEIIRASEAMRRSWEQTLGAIQDAIAKLRGDFAGNEQNGFAMAQAQFALKTAQARAGDETAAKALPALAQKLNELAKLNSASSMDYAIFTAATIASLTDTVRIAAQLTGANVDALRGLVPSYDVGTSYVPYDTLAMVHQGERILTANENRAWMRGEYGATGGGSGGADMEGLRSEVRAVVRELQDVRKTVQRWDGEGLPMEREEEVG